jgi:hypothetical protein
VSNAAAQTFNGKNNCLATPASQFVAHKRMVLKRNDRARISAKKSVAFSWQHGKHSILVNHIFRAEERKAFLLQYSLDAVGRTQPITDSRPSHLPAAPDLGSGMTERFSNPTLEASCAANYNVPKMQAISPSSPEYLRRLIQRRLECEEKHHGPPRDSREKTAREAFALSSSCDRPDTLAL